MEIIFVFLTSVLLQTKYQPRATTSKLLNIFIEAIARQNGGQGSTLVIWRNETGKSQKLLESSLQQITGHREWDSFAQTGIHIPQDQPTLCTRVAEAIASRKRPNQTFQIPLKKTKTDDETSYCVAQIGTGPVTHVVVRSVSLLKRIFWAS